MSLFRCLLIVLMLLSKVQFSLLMNISDYTVLIIGAGMSGLSAAQHLHANGINNIVVFEAKDRIGGRIYTKHIPTGPIEFGAQWIHGGYIVNSVYNLANLNKLLTDETCDTDDGPFLSSNGIVATEEFVKQVMQQFRNFPPCNDTSHTVESCFNENFDNLAQSYRNDERQVFRELFNVYKVQEIYDFGCELDMTAAKVDYVAIPCDIDIYDGTNILLNSLVTGIEDRIFLGHIVNNVNWTTNKITVTVKHPSSVEFTVFADNVISTVPLGYLKQKHSSLFTPQLPERKLKAIQNLIFGKVVKIMLFYKKPFWKRNYFKNLKLGITDEMYTRSRNEWVYRIVEISEVNDNPNILETFAVGDIATEVELIDNAELNEIITGILRNYTTDETIPLADNVYKSTWVHDEFTYGTYSRPGLNSNDATKTIDFEVMGEPLPGNGEHWLYTAGEATSIRYYGTMHGARDSGNREAKRIISKLHMQRNMKET